MLLARSTNNSFCRDQTLAQSRIKPLHSIRSEKPLWSDMINVSQLTKTYVDLRRGNFVAVDHVSFEVGTGEIFGLLGANGAGKTTVLRILSTVLKPTSGTVTIRGFDVQHQASQVRAQIGFVSNNTAIYDRMTAQRWSSFLVVCTACRPRR